DLSETLRLIGVRIPTRSIRWLIGSAIPIHLHQSHSCFNQTPGEQHALPKLCAAVAIAHFLGLASEVTRCSSAGRRETIKGTLSDANVIVERAGTLEASELVIQPTEKPMALRQSIDGHVDRQAELRDLEIG